MVLIFSNIFVITEGEKPTHGVWGREWGVVGYLFSDLSVITGEAVFRCWGMHPKWVSGKTLLCRAETTASINSFSMTQEESSVLPQTPREMDDLHVPPHDSGSLSYFQLDFDKRRFNQWFVAQNICQGLLLVGNQFRDVIWGWSSLVFTKPRGIALPARQKKLLSHPISPEFGGHTSKNHLWIKANWKYAAFF